MADIGLTANNFCYISIYSSLFFKKDNYIEQKFLNSAVKEISFKNLKIFGSFYGLMIVINDFIF